MQKHSYQFEARELSNLAWAFSIVNHPLNKWYHYFDYIKLVENHIDNLDASGRYLNQI